MAIPGPRAISQLSSPLALSLVVASVLVFLPGGLFRFAWPKVLILVAAVIPAALAKAQGRLPGRFLIALGVGAGIFGLAVLESPDPVGAFFGRWPRYEGLPMLVVYGAMLFLGAKLLGGPENEENASARLLWHRLLAVASLIVFAIGVLEACGLRPLGGGADVRPGATLGNATDEGLFGVLAFGALLGPSFAAKSWFTRCGCAAAAAVAVLSGSRAALLGLLVVLVVAELSGARTGRRYSWRSLAWIAGSVVAVAALVALIPASSDRLLTTGTVNGRWLLWQESLQLIAEHLWTGVGPSGFVDAIPAHHDAAWGAQVGTGFPPDSPHMWILQALAAGGIPLLLAAAVLTISVVALGVIRLRRTDTVGQRRFLGSCLAAVAAYGLCLLTAFTSPGTTPLALFMTGALISVPAAPGSAPALGKSGSLAVWRRPGRVVPAVAAAVVLLVLALPATVAEWPMRAGTDAAAQGRIDEADRQFALATALRPWDSDTALLAAEAFAGRAADGDPAAASMSMKWAQSSLARTPESLEAGLAMAIGQLNTGDLLGAKQRLDEMLARTPVASDLHLQRGIAEFGLGQPASSIEDLQTAAAQDPQSPLPWNVLAKVYNRLGDQPRSQTAQQHADRLASE
ncbi:O-antigen ligase family protein [Arthrobacter sp. NPDC080031]|uniref:O-antigen ligase family protein n=1 Tax=Arthrobacter sp. NPDC080031 TaxID=3155918 RepID=UPI003450E1EF